MKRKRNRRLRLDPLEQRRLLAVYSALPGVSDGAENSLRAALVATQTGGQDDTIELSAGTYRLDAGDLLVNEVSARLQIVGAGSDSTFIVIEGDSRFLDVDFDAVVDLSGVTILGGRADEGGQIRSAGELSVTDTVFHGGRAIQGGAIFNGGDLSLTDIEFWQNDAGWGGAIWNHAGATVDASVVQFVSNTSTSLSTGGVIDLVELGVAQPPAAGTMEHFFNRPGGAAIFNAGQFQGDEIGISQNRGEYGSIVINFGLDAVMRLDHADVYGNESLGHSVVANLDAELTVTTSAFFNNEGDNGILANHNGSLDLYAVSVFNNVVSGLGSVWSIGQLRMENVSIVGNLADTEQLFLSEWDRSINAGLFVANQPRSTTEMTGVLIDGNTTKLAFPPPPDFELEGRGDLSDVEIVPITFDKPANVLLLNGEFRSGGGNRFGPESKIAESVETITDSTQPSDIYLGEWNASDPQQAFELLDAGVYDGVAGVPPAASSRLVDILPPTATSIDGNSDGIAETDAGAIEFRPGLTRDGDLPGRATSDLTVQEDSSLLLSADNTSEVFAALGLVQQDAEGRWVYSPLADFFGIDRVVVQQSSGSSAAQIVEITPASDSPIANDDSIVALGRSEMIGVPFTNFAGQTQQPEDRNAVSNEIDVLDNDTAGPDGNRTVRVVDFTQAEHGVVENLHYSPDPGFTGADSFRYTIVNDSGLTSTATVNIEVIDPSDVPPIGELIAHIVDFESNPIDQVQVGETFYVELEIGYTGGLFHPVESRGRFNNAAAAVLIEGDSVQIAKTRVDETGDVPVEVPVRGQSILPGGLDYYPAVQSALQRDSSTVEYRATVGAIGGVERDRFYRIPVVADEAGEVTVTFDPTLGDFIILGGYGSLPRDVITSVGDSVEVVSGNTNSEMPEDVNGDQTVTAHDALIVINELGRITDGEGESSPRQSSYRWDVDGNGMLSALDALRIINYLDRQQKQAAQGVSATQIASGELINRGAESWVESDFHDPAPALDVDRTKTVDAVFADWSNQSTSSSLVAAEATEEREETSEPLAKLSQEHADHFRFPVETEEF